MDGGVVLATFATTAEAAARLSVVLVLVLVLDLLVPPAKWWALRTRLGMLWAPVLSGTIRSKDPVNNTERVAALEALLVKVQSNATHPRVSWRSAGGMSAPAAAAPAAARIDRAASPAPGPVAAKPAAAQKPAPVAAQPARKERPALDPSSWGGEDADAAAAARMATPAVGMKPTAPAGLKSGGGPVKGFGVSAKPAPREVPKPAPSSPGAKSPGAPPVAAKPAAIIASPVVDVGRVEEPAPPVQAESGLDLPIVEGVYGAPPIEPQHDPLAMTRPADEAVVNQLLADVPPPPPPSDAAPEFTEEETVADATVPLKPLHEPSAAPVEAAPEPSFMEPPVPEPAAEPLAAKTIVEPPSFEEPPLPEPEAAPPPPAFTSTAKEEAPSKFVTEEVPAPKKRGIAPLLLVAAFLVLVAGAAFLVYRMRAQQNVPPATGDTKPATTTTATSTATATATTTATATVAPTVTQSATTDVSASASESASAAASGDPSDPSKPPADPATLPKTSAYLFVQYEGGGEAWTSNMKKLGPVNTWLEVPCARGSIYVSVAKTGSSLPAGGRSVLLPCQTSKSVKFTESDLAPRPLPPPPTGGTPTTPPTVPPTVNPMEP